MNFFRTTILSLSLLLLFLGPQGEEGYIKVSRIHGTRPYLPAEFLRGNKFSTKVDTYSFGVVLFEIATSLPPCWVKKEKEENKYIFLRDHVMNYKGDILDLKRTEGYDSVFKGIMDIGKMCVKQSPKQRPEMVQVLQDLEKISVDK